MIDSEEARPVSARAPSHRRSASARHVFRECCFATEKTRFVPRQKGETAKGKLVDPMAAGRAGAREGRIPVDVTYAVSSAPGSFGLSIYLDHP